MQLNRRQLRMVQKRTEVTMSHLHQGIMDMTKMQCKVTTLLPKVERFSMYPHY
jgi:hypothetical protein